jgi:formylglycine-generating enzyme required for sulfatase activity
LSAKTGHYYRLPTEAEWEYACRAGSTTAYCFGNDSKMLDEYAWYFDNADDRYQDVGQKKPNRWGLHDMHGNVSEWVLDGYTPDGYRPTDKLAKSPLAVPTGLYPRVVRGGSWFDDPEMLRSAARVGSDKEWKSQDDGDPPSIWYHTDADTVGFRVVRPLRVPTTEQAARHDFDPIQIKSMDEYMKAKGQD